MPESEPDLTAFAYAYRQLAEAVYRLAPPEPSPFATLLEEHLGQPVSELPVVSMQLDVFDQANLQRAVDALLAEDGVELVQLVGIRGEHRMFGGVTLATLTQRTIRVEPGPVDYIERATDADASVTCIDFGLLLLRIDLERLAILVRRTDERSGGAGLQVEVMTAERRAGAAVLAHLRELMAVHNVFRTKVVSLAPGGPYGTSLDAKFVARPQLTRDDVVLPAGVLERIERMTVGFSGRAQSLRAGGRHLRRGLLLHGQPGAGKTHTVRYLMSRLTGHTVFVLSGQGLGVIPKTVALARQLQPAIVVLEDVDLVAEERTRPLAGTNPVLFELLNQMDGVEQDADITFLLTTNRPDLLEPALASRPGRVDLAVEVPLPAARERRRLLELYAQGLETDGLDWDPVVEGTDGYSAAFLRELLRQAALAAAGDDGQVPRLDDATLSSVLSDLASAAQAMTLRLLGSPQ